MPAAASPVRVEHQPATGIATLTLARPAAGNALDLATATALRDAVDALCDDVDRASVLVLAAEGSAFCVGGDLAEFAAVDDPAAHVARVASAVHAALVRLYAAPFPVVSVVQGVAAGGGVGLALVGDLVVAARSARLRLAYTAAGLSPDCGASWLLPRLVGAARAADLVLTNRTLSAAEAVDWGLVSRVVDDADLADAAAELAGGLASGPRVALRETRRLLRAAAARDLATQLDDEADTIARMAGAADGLEGVAAFLDKRRPRFGGQGRPPTAQPTTDPEEAR